MNKFTIPFSVDLLEFGALATLVPELSFHDVADLSEVGPFVYTLVEPRGGIIYYGKSDATTGVVGKRALAYAKWSADYLGCVSEAGRPDPLVDPYHGDLTLAGWAPIIRFQTRHQAIVRVASVAGTDFSGKVWEARLQAMAGTLTGLESLVGGSGWEANTGTLRGDGYEWAWDRMTELREAGVLDA
ncbi:hypothetical protein E3T28_07135 [Cryobacterium sinapicolor]|uniref:GIY-YIG nuclease family protein n=1 Tax=Cryobacterium sinapicolor TaxID=1259236 RepID=A0ABY2JAE5_9MICO|nr:hypothetical protein [Cryobacterium sinapicolor]TFD01323.1 hypothetical protein E3T28_07135 [Cryobacterium sinapicolor]